MSNRLFPVIALVCAAAIAGYMVIGRGEVPEATASEVAEASAPEMPASSAPKPSFRSPQPDIARSDSGVPLDPALAPTTPVAPWDDSALQDWMVQRRDQLEAQIKDEAILAMARDRTPRLVNGVPNGLYFQATYDAIDMVYDRRDASTRTHGLYVLLNTALAGDATAYHNLGLYLDQDPAQEGAAHAPALWRAAADRDFMPGLVMTVDDMARNPGADQDVREAYLRYGLDLGAAPDFGGDNILAYLRVFYVTDHPERPDDGYLQRAIERYQSFGDERQAMLTELEARLFTRALPSDPERRLKIAKAAAAMGEPLGMNTAGNAYMNALGTAFDADLSRDYLVACVRQNTREAYCLHNLASLYTRSAHDHVDYPLAVGLYSAAADRSGGPTGAAGREAARFSLELDDDGKALALRYRQAVAEGAFSELPHIRDARPIGAARAE